MFSLDSVPSLPNAELLTSLSASLLYLQCVHTRPSVWRMSVKAGSTALLSALSTTQNGPLLLSAALLLGAAGDAFLAWDGDTTFLCGLGSFLAAHILYIILFAQRGSGKARILGSSWRMVAASFLVCAFAPIMLSALMPKVARDLRLPILVYTSAIIMMVLTALTLDNPVLVSGAICFTVSDAVLSVDKFLVSSTSAHRHWMPYAVWILYYAGQLQIAVGLLD
ncbi:YhhN-like protein [Coniochaeta sp. 2T2.1]|nr:YhhN-like protein [Coniochaeta sp. 2T2.1]